MTLNEYQVNASEYAFFQTDYTIPYLALGITGEAGEVADKIKKIIRDRNSDFNFLRQDIAKELGDVIWYVSMMAKELGMTLEDVCKLNLIKLGDRKNRNTLRGEGDNR